MCNIKIPVIILNYNSAEDCKKCVSFLKKQEGVEVEIVIVDNCSRPDDLELVKELCKDEECTLLVNRENRGYSAGNNVGLKYAAEKGYQYALIANPDMEFPQRDYLFRLANKLEQSPEVVIVASDIVGLNGMHQNPMCRDDNWRGCFGWLTGFFKKKKKDTYDFIDNYRENHYCSKVSGCCFLIRMDFVHSIRYFDEQVFLYCEEAILSRQVEQKGLRMYYLADVQAVHAHVKNEKGDLIKRFEYWKRSRIYFINCYSGDSWWGKTVFKLSVRMYVFVLSAIFRLRKNG